MEERFLHFGEGGKAGWGDWKGLIGLRWYHKAGAFSGFESKVDLGIFTGALGKSRRTIISCSKEIRHLKRP